MNLIKALAVFLCITQTFCSQCIPYYGSEVTITFSSKDSIPNSVLLISCTNNSTKLDLSSLGDKAPNCPSVTIARFNLCVLDENLGVYFAAVGVDSSKVEAIVLSAAKVIELNSYLLQGFPNLKSFYVYHGNISRLSEDAFVGAPNLERIIMNDNLFETVPSSVFWKLTNLRLLALRGKIQTLPEDVFSRNINLELLQLFTNELRSLPENIFRGLSSLKTLTISRNHLSYLNETIFSDCNSLKTLDLHKNEINVLPQNLFSNCTQLEKINLSHNNIGVLPETIFRFNENLKKIMIDSNSITNLPQNLISHLLKLENISLSQNLIKNIPDTFIHNNNKMLRFELHGNYIDVLPDLLFSKGHHIKVIDLGKNNLTSLPERFFSKCLSLEKLRLDKNNINSFSLGQFPSAGSKLKEINLSRNRLALSNLYQYGSFVLTNQIALEVLDLSHNNISQMPYGLFSLLKLKYLNLEYNSIRYFAFQFFFEIVTNDVTINLRNNMIKTISAVAYGPINKKAAVSISGNPLNCDCKMFQFADFLRGNKGNAEKVMFSDVNRLLCDQPSNMNGSRVNTMELSKFTCFIPATNVSKCNTKCDCVMQPNVKRIFVNCSDRNLTEIPPMSMRRPAFPLSIDFSSNSLSSFNFTHLSFSSLTNLSLANNSLNYTALQTLLSQLPTQLEFLNLSANNVSSLEESFVASIENKSIIVDLSGSNWKCDCNLKPLHSFLQTEYSLISNRRAIFCDGFDTPLVDLTPGDICFDNSNLTAIIVLPLFAIIITVAATVTFFKYQTSFRVLLYSKRATRWLVAEKDIDADKEYDAFISYSHEDENFINETLVPGLENGDPKYKVCLHYRDWTPGELIQTQILESVANSRRTIVILSKNFISSVWAKMEFRVAHQKALKENTNRVIVIVYGEMPPFKTLDDELKHYVNTRTYLKYDNDRFWDSLKYAMPHKADGKKRRHIKLENVNGQLS